MNTLLTFKAIWHIDFQLNITKQHWQRHREISFGTERNMPVASLETIQRQYSLTKKFTILVIHANSQYS